MPDLYVLMKKIFLIYLLMLASSLAEAQGVHYTKKLRYCNAIQIIQTSSEIIEDGEKLSIRRAFVNSSSNKTQIYSWLQGRIRGGWGGGGSYYIEDNDSLVIFQQENYGTLTSGSKNKNVFTTCKIIITIYDYYFIVEISEITFAEFKKRKGKRKVVNEQTFESILQKEIPNCEIVKYIDENIEFTIRRFWK